MGKSNWLVGIIVDVVKSTEDKICRVYFRTNKEIVNRLVQHVTIIPSDLPRRDPEPDSDSARSPNHLPDLMPGNLDPEADQPSSDSENSRMRLATKLGPRSNKPNPRPDTELGPKSVEPRHTPRWASPQNIRSYNIRPYRPSRAKPGRPRTGLAKLY